MSAIDDMINVLRSRCGFEPAEVNSEKQVRILARIANTDNWRVVMQKIKALELTNTWTVDISKLFFLKTKNPKAPLIFGWRLIIKADNIEEACTQIATAVKNAPTARVTVDEIDLVGGGFHRNYSGAKGAHELGRGPAFSAGGR
jgi:hypothetical protein